MCEARGSSGRHQGSGLVSNTIPITLEGAEERQAAEMLAAPHMEPMRRAIQLGDLPVGNPPILVALDLVADRPACEQEPAAILRSDEALRHFIDRVPLRRQQSARVTGLLFPRPRVTPTIRDAEDQHGQRGGRVVFDIPGLQRGHGDIDTGPRRPQPQLAGRRFQTGASRAQDQRATLVGVGAAPCTGRGHGMQRLQRVEPRMGRPLPQHFHPGQRVAQARHRPKRRHRALEHAHTPGVEVDEVQARREGTAIDRLQHDETAGAQRARQ